MAGTRVDKNIAWESVFNALIGDPKTKFPFPVKPDGDYVTVSVSVDRVPEFKQKMSALFARGLPGSIQVRQSPAGAEQKESKRGGLVASPASSSMPQQAPEVNDAKEGRRIFQGFFGKKFKIAGATYLETDELFNVESGAQAKNGVLMSIPLDPDAAVKPYETVITDLARRFKGITTTRLQTAYCGTDKQLPEVKSTDSSPVDFDEGLFGQCLSVVTGPNAEGRPESRVYFNFRQAYELLSPPKMMQRTDEAKEGAMTHFRFEKAHFLSYLRRLAQSNVLLSEDQGIFLASQKLASEKRNTIYFAIDISASMGRKDEKDEKSVAPLDTVKTQLKTFINAFKNSPAAERTRARFILFGSRVSVMPELSMKECERILVLIEQLRADGNTCSSRALSDLFATIASEQLTSSDNVTVLYLGDGQDNDGLEEDTLVAQRAMASQRAKVEQTLDELIRLESTMPSGSATRPRFVALTCGLVMNSTDIDFYRKIAAKTAGEVHNEQDMQQALANLVEQLESLQYTREVLKVVQHLKDDVNEVFLPVPTDIFVSRNGEPQVFNLARPYGDNTLVYINGEQFGSSPAFQQTLWRGALPPAAVGERKDDVARFGASATAMSSSHAGNLFTGLAQLGQTLGEMLTGKLDEPEAPGADRGRKCILM